MLAPAKVRRAVQRFGEDDVEPAVRRVAHQCVEPKRDTPVDTVRPSRDGHQFHEAWVARYALGLLLSRNNHWGVLRNVLADGDGAVQVLDYCL
jgi:hypothetical protein